MMKILQINVFNYRKGGSETVYFSTIKMLEEQGHDVISFALKWPENYPSAQGKYFPDSKVTRKGLFRPLKNIINYFYHFEAAKKIEQLINDEKPDLAHIHLIWGQITPSILPVLKRHHIPIVFSIHDYRIVCPAYTCKNGKGEVCEQCKGKYFYHCILNKCTKGSYVLSTIMATEQYFRNTFFYPAKYIDGLIYVSKFAKKLHEKYMPALKTKKNIVLYNLSDEISASPQKELGDKYFLFFGRLSYEKGIKTLIDAFQELPQSKLEVVGTGPLETNLKQYKEKKKIKNIIFLGYKTGEELKRLVSMAYFIIVPSEWYENNPMTIIEGYSAGVPVIGSSIGGIPEIIEDGRTGFLFRQGNKHELIRAIEKAEDLSIDEYKIFSFNALNFATKNFNKNNYYPRLCKFYTELIHDKEN